MSSPRSYRLVLSPKAEQDIEDILRYTGTTWGEAQLLAYQHLLDEALRTLLNNPAAGLTSLDLSERYRLHLVGSDLIVDRVQEESIGVLRILHQRMSLALHV